MGTDLMNSCFKKVGVIGTGTMGIGIAGQVANSGVEVVFLDIASVEGERNSLPNKALGKMIKSGAQGPLMDLDFSSRITVGNIDDDLDLLADCDWIVEAVVERADIKRELFLKINGVRKPTAFVSSNTSTIPLSQLMNDMPEDLIAHFLITHFFNPPRHMRLLEVVCSKKMSSQTFEAFQNFAEHTLGKSLVVCNDRPGFIANRLGIYWIHCALSEAVKFGLTIEQADSLISSVLAIPTTGVFGLLDLIGIDLLPEITNSIIDLLETDDPLREYNTVPKVISEMIELGYLGRKSGGGFYRMNVSKPGKEKESLDLDTFTYRRSLKAEHSYLLTKPSEIGQIISHDNVFSEFLRNVIVKTLHYATHLISDAADTPMAIDEAMRLGYNWKYGPFELIDYIGADTLLKLSEELETIEKPTLFLSALKNENVYSFFEGKPCYFNQANGYLSQNLDEEKLSLKFIRQTSVPVFKNLSGNLWDIGDGVVCLEITTKMNVISSEVLILLEEAISITEKDFSALVIYNEGSAFAAGANLDEMQNFIHNNNYIGISNYIKRGQSIFKKLKNASVPVVGAPSGFALGGGCELLLHCHGIVSHSELYMGLVELNIGLVPAWGGIQELLIRCSENKNSEFSSQDTFDLIVNSVVTKSAFEAQKLGFLRSSDTIVMNRDFLLKQAKLRAISMMKNHEQPSLPYSEKEDSITIDISKLSDHEQLLACRLKEVFVSGLDFSESERATFVELIKTRPTQDRIEHMLKTGKVLNN